MYLKLFGFMAILCSFEVFSHFFPSDAVILTDILNCFQGIIIFIIFVLQKNIRDLIVQRYNAFRGFPEDRPANAAENNSEGENKNFQKL